MLNSLSRFGSRLGQTFNLARQFWAMAGSVRPASLNRFQPQALTSDEAWESHAARLERYHVYEGYYSNQVYNDIQIMARLQQGRPKLYKWIRGVSNPTQRLVDLRQAKIYGGSLDMETALTGAMPIVGADDNLRQTIIQVWLWSNMQQRKSIFARHGTLYGDAAWQIVDAPAYGMVWLEPILPHTIVDYTADTAGELTSIELACDRTDPANGQRYTYRQIITLDKFYTFKDSEPYAYHTDLFDQPVSEWDNEYGFIPVVLAQDVATGFKFGETGFAHTLTKIDEVNDQASLLNDQIRKVINPRWALFGAKLPPDGLSSTASRDSMDFLEFPSDGSIAPFANPLDIAATRLNIDALQLELERDMPELSLHRIREGGGLTAPGVQAAYSDASDRILEAQGNYDGATVKALQMAITIGGYRGYEGFAGYSLDQFWNRDLAFSIKPRPIINDTLSKQERLTVLQTIGNTELLMQELEFDEETIERILNREDDQTRAAMQGIASAAFGQQEEMTSDPTEPTQPQAPGINPGQAQTLPANA
jgi:hypothetical protein